MDKGSIPCRYFTGPGTCFLADSCPYLHDLGGSSGNSGNSGNTGGGMMTTNAGQGTIYVGDTGNGAGMGGQGTTWPLPNGGGNLNSMSSGSEDMGFNQGGGQGTQLYASVVSSGEGGQGGSNVWFQRSGQGVQQGQGGQQGGVGAQLTMNATPFFPKISSGGSQSQGSVGTGGGGGVQTSAGSSSSSSSSSASSSSSSSSGHISSSYVYGGQVENPQYYSASMGKVVNRYNKTTQTAFKNVKSFFVPDDLRTELINKRILLHKQLDEEDPRVDDMPDFIKTFNAQYHSLYPLDDLSSANRERRVFRYPTVVFRTVNLQDGNTYALRRVDNLRLTREFSMKGADPYQELGYHPNIVQLHDVFITDAFGMESKSVCFVHDFFPGSETLESAHFQQLGGYLAEEVLWSYACQIVAAIRHVHAAGLACRVIDASKIVLTGQNRVRVNGIGIHDVVQNDEDKGLNLLQNEDLFMFGGLMLSLACKSPEASQNPNKSLEFVEKHYSADFKNLIVFLLTKAPTTSNYPSVTDLTMLIAPKLMKSMENEEVFNDGLMEELSKEIENGRLFRIMCKLGFINERPHHNNDDQWSETADRYLLKLFRDFVFHQVTEEGVPVLDLVHVVDCLNKLDVGHNEKITLMSRDQKDILVVSYSDLKKCIEKSFLDLMRHR